jgi:hypothetical protein
MNRIKSFFVGSVLLIIVFMMVLVSALLYRANERMTIKTYFFQMNNFANQRVGPLQDINDISINDLRNKLIKRYVSEYFKVVPGESDVTQRPVLEKLSSESTFKKWKDGEAKTISKMSSEKKFRAVKIYDDGIATITKSSDTDYETSGLAKKIYYEVRYNMYTWNGSNILEIQPTYEQGTVYIEARFKPGIKPDISVRKYLEEGHKPVEMFMFEVTNVGTKEDI